MVHNAPQVCECVIDGVGRTTLVITLLLWFSGCSTAPPPSLAEVRKQVRNEHYDAAERAIHRAFDDGGQTDSWRVLAAECRLRQRNHAGCLDELNRLPAKPSGASAGALAELGQIAIDKGAIVVAERCDRLALAANPSDSAVIINLGYLLGFEGRCWEAAELHGAAVRFGHFTLHHLVLLGASDPVIDDPALRERCLKALPDDPLPRLGEARTAIRMGQPAQARALLEQIVAIHPECGEAQGQLGQLYAFHDPERFTKWQAQIPSSVDAHPEIWFARGLWSRQQQQTTAAVRCFWEVLRLDANHRAAHFQLGQGLVSLQRTTAAQACFDRAAQLQELAALVDDIFRHPTDTQRMQRAEQLTTDLARPWEASAWAQTALQVDPSCDWAIAAVARSRNLLTPETPLVLDQGWLARRIDTSSDPLPDYRTVKVESVASNSTGSGQNRPFRFDDQAMKTGLQFLYQSRSAEESGDMRMYETTGGGVAVCDYDGDHWPDLYFTQAGALSQATITLEGSDRCFRNVGGERWQDVTQAAGLEEVLYGQGVTAGDFDNDGFVDLSVANLGRNRLLKNQGDGTFQDVTELAGFSSERWTTSCLMADLNADGLPDIYDVNYLSREDAIRATCRVGEEVRWCSPDSFAAEQDQVFLNLGDGRFQDVTAESGIVHPQGKGMGILAADFHSTGRISLFVANDNVPNFFLENQTTAPGGPLRFIENALLKGLAVDANGLPQACMGVAYGDWNGDRLPDLFVTNFYEQSNTVYQQLPGSTFEDTTRKTGLRDPSWLRLGFGTQALDADLDGWPDLVVANGHVLDLSATGIPFRMRPQVFRNLGHGQFHEQVGPELGEYFQRETLGRGLARLDWNRDGRPDFVVSNIGHPAALSTNQTLNVGHVLAVRLVGVQSSRDAIGAEITIKAGDRVFVQQVVTGDGYQCRNEARVVFGLGTIDQIDRWSVRWPSGVTVEYDGIAADVELLVTENRPTVIELRRWSTQRTTTE